MKQRNEWSNVKIINFEAIEEQGQYYILINLKNINFFYNLKYKKADNYKYGAISDKIYKKKLTFKDLRTMYNDIDLIKLINEKDIKYDFNTLGEMCFNKNAGDCNKLVDILNGILVINNIEQQHY